MRDQRSSSAVTFVGMIMVVLAQASNMVVVKVAMSEGINKYCLILYTDALSTLILLPSLLLLFRSNYAPPLTPSLLLKFFLLSLIGFMAHVCGLTGIDLSSPSLGTALMNVVPALTFSLALVFRMEKMDWKSSSSQTKLVGTIVSIAGAFIATFYKGHPIMSAASPLSQLGLSPNSRWTLGGFLFAGEALMLSLLFIVQAMILKDYPSFLIMTFFMTLFATMIAALFSLVVVNDDPRAWRLTLDNGLLCIVYSSLVSGVFRLLVSTWCLKKAGPLYVSMFNPIGIIFAVALGVIFLGDPLCIGSLIGAAVIVCGFYGVMWGKAKEEEKWRDDREVGNHVAAQSPDPNHKTPLLDAP